MVFFGPSLALTQAQAILDATYLGPLAKVTSIEHCGKITLTLSGLLMATSINRRRFGIKKFSGRLRKVYMYSAQPAWGRCVPRS